MLGTLVLIAIASVVIFFRALLGDELIFNSIISINMTHTHIYFEYGFYRGVWGVGKFGFRISIFYLKCTISLFLVPLIVHWLFQFFILFQEALALHKKSIETLTFGTKVFNPHFFNWMITSLQVFRIHTYVRLNLI